MTRQITLTFLFCILSTLQILAQTTNISGRVDNPTNTTISLQWESDPISGIVKESIIGLNGDNHFSALFDISEPVLMHMKYGGSTKILFIEPGDDLQISFEGNTLKRSFSFSGKGGANNQFLNDYEQQFGRYTDSYFDAQMASKPAASFRAYMDDIHGAFWDYYMKNAGAGLSYDFREYIKADMEYRWANALLEYRFGRPRGNQRPGPIALPKSFYTFLDLLPIQNQGALLNPNYRAFIPRYLKYQRDAGSGGIANAAVRVESEMLSLRAEPHEKGEKWGNVYHGEYLKYLKEKSSNSIRLYLRGKKVDTKWIKVRTSNNQIGWVVEGGVDYVTNADDTPIGKMAGESSFMQAGKHFKGKVLEYFVANELHRSVHQTSLPYGRSAFSTFLSHATDAELKRIIKEDFLRKFGDAPGMAYNGSAPTPQVSNPSAPTPPRAPSKRPLPRSTNYVLGRNQTTILKGKVENPAAQKIEIIFYEDKFAFSEKILELPLDPRGHFNFAFDLSEPTLVKIVYNGQRIALFLEPGDVLEANFNSSDLVQSVEFKGPPAAQNRFLNDYNKAFDAYDENYVYGNIVGQHYSNYRFDMDKIRRQKRSFLHQYDRKAITQFSKGFHDYIAAEIDYWWANNLLRYYWEHPAANGKTFPMHMSSSYFNFLGKVSVSNDRAMASRSYLDFLSLYIKFRQGIPDDNILMQIQQGHFKSRTPGLPVMDDYRPGANQITELFEDEDVKFLHVKSPDTSRQLVNGRLRTGYWYLVSTNNGYTGWVFGPAGQLSGAEEDIQPSPANRRYQTVQTQKTFTQTVAVVMVDRLRIRAEPHQPRAIGFANEGDELIYLGQTSPQRQTFTLRGTTYTEYFYQIQTNDGDEGWVFGGGIELQDRTFTQNIQKNIPVEQPATTKPLAKSRREETYLEGRAYYYTLANELYWKCKGSNDTDRLKKEIRRFKRSNPYDEFDIAMQNAYEDAVRRVYASEAKPAAEKPGDEKGTQKEKERIAKEAADKKAADEAERREKERLAEIERNKQLEREAEERERLLREKRERNARWAETEKQRKEELEHKRKEQERLNTIAAEKERKRKEAEEKKTAERMAAIEKQREANRKKRKEWEKEQMALIKKKRQEQREEDRNKGKQPPTGTSNATTAPAVEAQPAPEAPLPKVEPAPPSIAGMPTAPKTNPFKLDQLDECILDGIAQGFTEARAMEDCKKTLSGNGAATPAALSAPSSAIPAGQSPAELFESISLEPVSQTMHPVNVSGKITNHRSSKEMKIILILDPVSRKEVSYHIFVKDDGTFSTILKVDGPTVGKLLYGARSADLFIEPSKDIRIDFFGRDFRNSLSFTGPGGEPNNFLNNLGKNFLNADKEVRGKIFSEEDHRSFREFITKVYQDKLAYYQRESAGLSYNFTRYALARIDYWFAYNMVNYRWEHPLNMNRPSPMTINDGDYYKFMNRIELNNPDAIADEYYAYYLNIYVDDRASEPENSGLSQLELADKYLSGEALYFYKAQRLSSDAESGKLADIMYDIKRFMEECPYPAFKESMKMVLRESSTLLPGMEAPGFTLVDLEGGRVSLDDFRGKVVYLDFWATWCNSCIHHISNTSEMRRQMADKDVVFLFVSIDNTPSEWRSYVRSKYISGVHLYSEGVLGSSVVTDYGVKQLPAAFLIDQEGRIVSSSGMKVGNSYNLMEEIYKLLNRQ